ncbi:hypothetical protein JSO19_03805 [Leucobacter sp. UCMA 4100]|uniref:hypothetical protein n=1 Tax=Leucobacter sp. UCMA 4100 TaxID=2810534 RepID=UPI0022EA118F|nr:hypothetical protein [Leucobacter sp. UCMA 4100]MDA3146500.1 hypothetical protein [Leucobacter sp. UCMA 4100]
MDEQWQTVFEEWVPTYSWRVEAEREQIKPGGLHSWKLFFWKVSDESEVLMKAGLQFLTSEPLPTDTYAWDFIAGMQPFSDGGRLELREDFSQYVRYCLLLLDSPDVAERIYELIGN